MDARRINEATVTDFYTWLRKESDAAPIVQRKLWGHFRRLVRYLWNERVIELPGNLEARTFTFDVQAKAIKKYEPADIRELLTTLPRRLRLYPLLALNRGILGVDMATLRHEGCQGGRLIRKRRKTRNAESVPTVSYLLWLETASLLSEYPPSHPEFVLTSLTGSPLWTAEVRDGKKVKKDSISLQWHRGRGEGRETKPTTRPLPPCKSTSTH
jgi:hypothetical protein